MSHSTSLVNHRIKSSRNFMSVTTEMIYFHLEFFPSSFNRNTFNLYGANVSAKMEQK